MIITLRTTGLTCNSVRRTGVPLFVPLSPLLWRICATRATPYLSHMSRSYEQLAFGAFQMHGVYK